MGLDVPHRRPLAVLAAWAAVEGVTVRGLRLGRTRRPQPATAIANICYYDDLALFEQLITSR